MRRSFPGTLMVGMAVAVLAATASVANAQITLVPGPQISLARSPQYLAVADFDGDQYEDAVVTNLQEDKMSVLFGQNATTFGRVIDFLTGKRLSRVVTADMNGDRFPDIVTFDRASDTFYIVFGNGDGTFKAPRPYQIQVGTGARRRRARPVDIAAGNFNGDTNGTLPYLDLMFVSGSRVRRSQSIFMIRNLGPAGTGNGTDFDTANPSYYEVGRRPKRGLFEDLNGDGFADAMVLNRGRRSRGGADDISVLINAKDLGNGNFVSPPTNFVVGIDATDMATGDFNGDGVPDLAVVNKKIVAGATRANEFTVSILLNRTRVDRGRLVGTGYFNVVTPLDLVQCPSSLSGVEITCSPTAITSGDFDGDGLGDYAIAFNTKATGTNAKVLTQGLIIARRSVGDGTFDLATSVRVGYNPTQLQAGDFTGDGVYDMIVVEKGSKAVRMVMGVPPPRLPNGLPCSSGRQCIYGNCVDGVCCSSATCTAPDRCDIQGHEGTCYPPASNGTPCQEPDECASGFCVDGSCCQTRNCPPGLLCNTGTCQPPAPNGAPCSSDLQCQSGHCTDGACCEDSRCPANESCNIPGFAGQCHTHLGDGSACTDDRQCASGYCTEGVCCEVRSCGAGQSCAIPPREGLCSYIPTPTPTVTPTSTPTPTPTPAPLGNPCLDGKQCISGYCTDGVCCSTAFCAPGFICNFSGSEGTCKKKNPEGGLCQKPSDCDTDNCVPGNPPVCGPPKTPTPTRTATPVRPGGGCSSTSQCEGGYFCNQAEGGICCNRPECNDGFSCRIPGSEGICNPIPAPTSTPTPKRDAGTSCTDSSQCRDGLFCTDRVCCTEAECDLGESCNVSGYEGDCSLPLGVDDECEKNSDCLPPLQCLPAPGGVFRCQPPPEPTDAFPPTATRTPSPPYEVDTHRSGGGCSIETSATGGELWLLLMVPLAVWLRRRGAENVGERN